MMRAATIAALFIMLGATTRANSQNEPVSTDGGFANPRQEAKTYQFWCADKPYTISIVTTGANNIRLQSLGLPDASSPEEMQKVQEALNGFSFVYEMGAKCIPSSGSILLHIDGRERLGPSKPSGPYTMTISIANGKIIRIDAR